MYSVMFPFWRVSTVAKISIGSAMRALKMTQHTTILIGYFANHVFFTCRGFITEISLSNDITTTIYLAECKNIRSKNASPVLKCAIKYLERSASNTSTKYPRRGILSMSPCPRNIMSVRVKANRYQKIDSFCCLACFLSTPTPRLLLMNPNKHMMGFTIVLVTYENCLTSASETAND